MRNVRRHWIAGLLLVLAFLGGFALARTLYLPASTASARGQADRFRQVLTDLQRDYYKPLDMGRLGHKGIAAVLASLHDPYTVYFSPKQARLFSQELSGSYTGIGVAVHLKAGGLTVMKVFPGSPAARAGITPGEVIVSVDGTPTAGKPASEDIAHITGPAGTRVRLQLRRAAAPRRVSVTLTRRTVSEPLTTSRLIQDHGTKVGYVALSAFAKGAGAQVRAAVSALQRRGARWIVLDLRDNGGGLVNEAAAVAGDFLPAGKPVTTMQGAHSPKDVVKASGGPPSSLPLAVLVNGNTASAAEIVTGALQDYHRGTIIGSRTFGKGVVQTTLQLSGGAELKITIASWFTPRGQNINHKGILPSVVVTRQPSTGTDPALSRALRFIATGR